MKSKIGVYVCHCGGNISDYVDVNKVREAVKDIEGVEVSIDTMFACADSSQKQIADDISEKKLDGLVVASCSPKLHYPTFSAVAERGGLNKYNYVHANIREQVSWAHSDDKEGATEKAIKVVKAAIARVKESVPLKPIEVKSQKSIAILGAGVAGMRAAKELADLGIQVYLIEREHFVGGRVSQLDYLCGAEETGKELVSRLYEKINKHPNVTLFTGAEVIKKGGSIGNFKIQVKITPRYINGKCDKEDLEKAIEVCPVEVDDDFNFHITKRKAIYKNYSSEYPQIPTIDNKNCTRCGECEKVCSDIDFSQKEEVLNLTIGSILAATGFDPYQPKENEFGWGIGNVVTLPQFRRIINMCDNKLVYQGKEIKDIAYIYCVGSRQVDGDNKYCSRYCCTATLYTSILTHKKYKGINSFHFNRGIRTYGKQEIIYDEASQLGDIFLQSYEYDPATVEENGDKTTVKIKDILTGGQELEVNADLVVLVTGMEPRNDCSIGDVLKIPKGRDRFYNEIHMKLRPVETVIDGVTIAGACQGPKNIMESMNSALSAAAKSYSIVNKGELTLEPIIAKVDKDSCIWCDKCAAACPYDAISMIKENGKDIAEINESVCKGCGMCLPVCESDSIDMDGFTNNEIESMINILAMS
ncbi:MAG: CoB--CoM heterodisulfide reductase iron-sulfur subunit A family protein [Bacteroidetes bacterium]|nr:MAG: CoB--CoM heterodisulfide reductase iron-sulfur subunit A family protein [Bacteroidota bacterium]